MSFTSTKAQDRLGSADVAVAIGITVTTLAAAAIHFGLGSLLFMMNAAGYATLAVAYLAPIALAERFRWLIRVALLGFTAATIVGWVLVGPRFGLAYLTKGIELTLIVLLVVDIYRAHGGTRALMREAVEATSGLVRGLARA